jgi:ubiquitin-like 1-activating enzyme E1 A
MTIIEQSYAPTNGNGEINQQPDGSNRNAETSNSNGATSGETASTTQGLSADEIALYDRQIRLWGAQAQERIRSANILLISLRALGTEIAKNLTLAGVKSLTIVDGDVATEEDLGCQYFLRQEDIGKLVSWTNFFINAFN